MLKVALVYEGSGDTDVLKEFINKLLVQQNVEFDIPSDCCIQAKTGIIGYIVPQAKIVFENRSADLGIFITDQDVPRAHDERRSVISEKLNKLGYRDKSAIGVPNPHLESWLFADEDVVKSVFNLPREQALPFANLQGEPKRRLKAIYGDFTPQGSKFSEHEARSMLAQNISLDRLTEVQEFRLMADEVRQIISLKKTMQLL
jgi:hypothetical protein